MNKRERTLLILIGSGIGLFVVYQAINFLFISPKTTAIERIENLTTEHDKLERLMRSRKRLVRDWQDYAARTISFDSAEIANRFSADIKHTAARNGFENPLVTPAGQGKIGSKTDIMTIVYRVNVDGPYQQAINLLNDVSALPYLSRITRLSVVPIVQKGRGRNDVKVEFVIETPMLPSIDKKKMPDAAAALAMNETSPPPQGPARIDLPEPTALAILTTRNIFRPYLPPPLNSLKIDNQDPKTVALKATFFWEGAPSEQLVETVAGKSQKPISAKGDVVEISGSYADGTKFGPERLDFNLLKNAVYQVRQHTIIPPDVIDLAVDNQSKDAIDVEVTLTYEDGKKRTMPTMRIKPGRMDIDEYQVKNVHVLATYPSGKKAAPMTYSPATGKQVYVVAAEGVEPVKPPPTVEVAVGDPPPDPTLSVSGLVTYNGTQEMVGSAGGTRKVFTAGVASEVDGGMLLGVHPLGGVVKMPSGNFYLYPLGRRFAERVQLDASDERELAAAIDEAVDELAEMPTAAAPAANASPARPGPRTPGAPMPGRPGRNTGRP